jgi:two-component system OmpR family response regulator
MNWLSPQHAGRRRRQVQVLRLRRKLEVNPSAPRVIQTERDGGYIFALAVEPF